MSEMGSFATTTHPVETLLANLGDTNFSGGFFPLQQQGKRAVQRNVDEATSVTIASICDEAPSLFKTFPFQLPLPFFASALISERKAMLFSDFALLPVVSDLNPLMTAPALKFFVLSTSSSNDFSFCFMVRKSLPLQSSKNDRSNSPFGSFAEDHHPGFDAMSFAFHVFPKFVIHWMLPMA
jgi:hypothetical protein